VILVDHMNTALELQPYMHDHIVRLAKSPAGKQRLAIMVLTDATLRVIHDFTDSPEHLAAVMKEMTPERWTRPFSGNRNDLYTMFHDRELATTSAMQDIARHLASVPGRKNLIWVSGSFPMFMNNRAVQMDFTTEIARALQPLSDANVAVYPVDARGLITGTATPEQPTPVARGRGRAPVTVTEPPALNTLNYVAEQTGGKAYYNSNGIEESIEQAMDDGADVYTLGFYPAEGTLNDSFHKLKVDVNVPKVEVRSRPGYFASKNAPAATARPALQELVKANLDATGIGLLAAINSVTPEAIDIQLSVDINDVYLQLKDGVRTGALDIVVSNGVQAALIPVPVQQTETQYREALAKRFGLTWSIPITLNGAQVSEMRVVVQDHTTGAAGSIRLPVQKP
jgi:VWFA-related protein